VAAQIVASRAVLSSTELVLVMGTVHIWGTYTALTVGRIKKYAKNLRMRLLECDAVYLL
jgi:hypothetical protein